MKWYPLQVDNRSDYVLMLYRSEIELHDSLFDFGSLTTDVSEGLMIERLSTRNLVYT